MELKNLIRAGQGFYTEIFRKVGQGFYAEVFKIGKDAIKCPLQGYPYRNYPLREEFEIQQQLFKAKIKVPEPYEILEVRLKDRTTQALRMEFIEGKNIEKMRMDKNRMLAERLYYQELDKAIALGFQPYDTELHNAVYSKNRGVYLIDFYRWTYGK